MKKNKALKRFISLIVAISMIFTLGLTVLAQNSGALTLGTSVDTTTVNSSSRYYYTFTPTVTGAYTLTAKRYNNSAGSGRITIYTSVTGSSGYETFSGEVATYNVTSTRNQTFPTTGTLQLQAGTTYYFRVRSSNSYGTTNSRMTMTLNKNFATITFNGNGSTSTMDNFYPTLNTASSLPACTMTRDGYEFAGWATSAAGDVVYADKASVTPTGDMTLYALWNEIYTIQYNANSGSGTTPASQTGTSGSTITLPSGGVTRNNYHLMGWSTSRTPGASDTIYPLGGEYTITGNTTLYAVWGRTLTYNNNGGTGSIEDVYALVGSTVVLPGTDAGISREGATLVGWGTSRGATSYTAPGGDYQMPNQNRTLYAIWRSTLTFDSNGGTGTIQPRSIAPGTLTYLPSTGITRTGYGLRGWDESSTATTPAHSVSTYYTLNGDTTLYAVWGPQLTYNGNGGTGFIQGGTYDYNYQVQLSSNTGYQRYTRNDYTILGWARSADATAPEFGLGGTLTITEPTTLYAVWGRNTTFEPNGGVGNIPSIISYPDQRSHFLPKVSQETDTPWQDGHFLLTVRRRTTNSALPIR